METKRNRIVVFGGTGFYGRKVVEKLLNKGEIVRVVSRNKEYAKEIVGEAAEIFEGDVTDPKTIQESLSDVDAVVICLSAMKRKLIKKIKLIERDAVLTIMEEAKKADIQRLVYMSGYEIREELLCKLNIPEFGKIKIEIENKIKSSEFNWTILGDAPAFDIFFAFVRKGKMTVPGGGKKQIPAISPEDVGEITSQVVLRDDLSQKRLKLTGSKAYSFPEVAELITELSGKPVKHIKIPLALINIISFILIPFNPFVRYLFKSLKMLNNFPQDLAVEVPQEHQNLQELFNYKPVNLETEIKSRLEKGLL